MKKKKPKQDEKMYTAREIATRFNVPITTVRWWLRNRLFPNQKKREEDLNTYWVVPASDLATFKRPQVGRPAKKSAKDKKNR